jgi:hypothetical protein
MAVPLETGGPLTYREEVKEIQFLHPKEETGGP